MKNFTLFLRLALCYFLFSTSFLNAQVGIGTTNPDDDLDVIGNTQVSGYLRVGEPALAATSITNTSANSIFNWDTQSTGGLFINSECFSGNQWVLSTSVGGVHTLQYDNIGSRTREYIYSPWAWVPSTSIYLALELTFSCDLENNFDGVFVEYTTDGTTWTKLNFTTGFGNYTDNAAGNNTACTANDAQLTWNGNMGETTSRSNDFIGGLAGSWVQVRFVGMEDASVGTGTFDIHGFALWVDTVIETSGPSGSFTGGNIYAENNVYAGSNVLVGDMAEYFPVRGKTLPGDLISINPKANDSYEKTNKDYDSNVIGVYSSNPTLTLNSPEAGVPVGLSGRVLTNFTHENGEIKVGDYLTSSSTGKAMKADKSCYIIGRSLENSYDKKNGKVLCLLESGWYHKKDDNTTSLMSGNFFIGKGKKEIVVKDASVAKKSKVFVSMQGDLGTNHWISNISDGAFTIKLREGSLNDVNFDYFIQNANQYTNEKQTKQSLVVNTSKKSIKKKDLKGADTNNKRDSGTKITKLPILMDLYPPVLPEDKTKAYTWSSDKGLKQMNE